MSAVRPNGKLGGTNLVRKSLNQDKTPVNIGLGDESAQSIIGATLKRREGSGRVVFGFEADSRGILVYTVLCRFPGF